MSTAIPRSRLKIVSPTELVFESVAGQLTLQSGELVMFDNCRLLHGRTSVNPQQGLRHLQGCYIDIDGPRSLYRVLRRTVPQHA